MFTKVLIYVKTFMKSAMSIFEGASPMFLG